jgi:hypothetical protein
MVIINAGMIYFCDELNIDTEIPYLLYFDGLGLQDMNEIAANLRCWLNADYDRKKVLVVIFPL